MSSTQDVCNVLRARGYHQIFGNITVPFGQENVSITAPISGQAKFYWTDGRSLKVAVVKLSSVEFTAQRGQLTPDEPAYTTHSKFLTAHKPVGTISMADAVREFQARRA